MKRLASLDAFRGLAIASMILVNNPGSWAHVYRPLDHAEWNGCTFTDLVFPFFLFAAGLAMTLSLGRQAAQGLDRPRILAGILRRALLLILIGVTLNFIPAFDPASLRFPGVLQRIGLCIILGAPVLLWGRWRAILAAILVLSGVYLVLMLCVPVAGGDGLVAAGRLLPGQDFGAWLDRLVFGAHLYRQARTWDPEGLVSTLPAVTSLLFGALAGSYLRSARPRHAPGLLLAGLAMLGLGALAGQLLPINKNLWTPSYAVFTGGWALVVLAGFQVALDEAPAGFRERARQVCLPLTIYGMNALFLFVLSGLVGRLLQAWRVGPVSLKAWLFEWVARLPLTPLNASLVFAVLFNLGMFCCAWVMWRRRWFVKL
jgi:predicted acyltransferase